MKYTITFNTTTQKQAVIEAESKEHAKELIESGQFPSDSVTWAELYEIQAIVVTELKKET